VMRSGSVVGILMGIGLAGCSGERSDSHVRDETSEKAWLACEKSTRVEPCLDWGRASMSAPLPDSMILIERERGRLVRLFERFPHDEAVAISGAGVVRLGGWLASHDDVLKGVEYIDEGLERLDSGMKRYPSSRALRIYFGTTLSHLPKDFQKGPEGRDTLLALKRNFALSNDELRIVDEALARIGN
jgi:hypothetical protein